MAVTVVGGLAGVGKTQWVRQRIQQHQGQGKPMFYFAPGEGQLPLDRTLLQLEFPDLVGFTPDQEADLIRWVDAQNGSFWGWIELGVHMDLDSGAFLLAALGECADCRHVALLPESLGNQPTPWHLWADEVILLPTAATQWQELRLWRSPLSGQVFEPRSLETFWQELTLGAYGSVIRGKGLFELPDGRCFYLDFRTDAPPSLYLPVQRERWHHGRPQRFSGIELVGTDLQRPELIQAITDCCLTDEQLAYHQQSLPVPNP